MAGTELKWVKLILFPWEFKSKPSSEQFLLKGLNWINERSEVSSSGRTILGQLGF